MNRQKVLKAIKNPKLAVFYLSNKLKDRLIPSLYRNDMNFIKFGRLLSLRANTIFQRRMSNIKQTNVMERDWDNLIILDGCRYDTYEDAIKDRSDFSSKQLESIYSVGSASPEWISKTFDSKNYHDSVYISSNPFTRNITEGTFYAVYDLISDDKYWSDEVKTVPPQTMTKATREIAQNHPQKRLIVHYMQPHHPFLGESSKELSYNRGVYGKEREKQSSKDPWDNAYSSLRVNHELLRRAYRENLHIVLNSVSELLSALTGKTAISADHANLIGDRGFPIPMRGYGHPPGIFSEPLLNVPWHEFSTNKRKTIQKDPPLSQDKTSNGEIEERLEYLGYK